jgi:hypothetical protein
LAWQEEENGATLAKRTSVGSADEDAMAISKASADEAMTSMSAGKAWMFAAQIATMIDQVIF